MEDMWEQDFSSLFSRGQIRQWNKRSRLGETINNSEDDSVTIRWEKASDEVQGDVGSGPVQDGQGLQEAGRSLLGLLCWEQIRQAVTNALRLGVLPLTHLRF